MRINHCRDTAGQEDREEERRQEGKHTRLHIKAKWIVLFLYPLSQISISFSCSLLPVQHFSLSLSSYPLLHLLKSPFAGWKRKKKRKKRRVSNTKLTGSPLDVHPTDTCWFFFSLKLRGIGVEGTIFPSHTVQTHRLLLQRQHIYSGLIGMLRYSPTAEPQLAVCGRELEQALTWNRTARKKQQLLVSAQQHPGKFKTSDFIYRKSCCELRTIIEQTTTSPKTLFGNQLGTECNRTFYVWYFSGRWWKTVANKCDR